MSATSKAKPRGASGSGKKRGHYVLRLFVAGTAANSKQAVVNLRNLCRQHLNGRCTIETVDVTKDYEAAVRNNILVTPALVLVEPLPRVVVLGNLSDPQKVLEALRLAGSEP